MMKCKNVVERRAHNVVIKRVLRIREAYDIRMVGLEDHAMHGVIQCQEGHDLEY